MSYKVSNGWTPPVKITFKFIGCLTFLDSCVHYILFDTWRDSIDHLKSVPHFLDIIKIKDIKKLIFTQRHNQKVFGFEISFELSLVFLVLKEIMFIYYFIIDIMSRDKQTMNYHFPQFKIKTFNEHFKSSFP